jgi:C4-dicarboxylate-specific signal transduction histidine kinase
VLQKSFCIDQQKFYGLYARRSNNNLRDYIICDELTGVQLQQVLLNLIINAIEAMRDVGEEERELLISSRNEPDAVSVEVRDSGPGFAPAALERVE